MTGELLAWSGGGGCCSVPWHPTLVTLSLEAMLGKRIVSHTALGILCHKGTTLSSRTPGRTRVPGILSKQLSLIQRALPAGDHSTGRSLAPFFSL
jgi:hypothetical protein